MFYKHQFWYLAQHYTSGNFVLVNKRNSKSRCENIFVCGNPLVKIKQESLEDLTVILFQKCTHHTSKVNSI